MRNRELSDEFFAALCWVDCSVCIAVIALFVVLEMGVAMVGEPVRASNHGSGGERDTLPLSVPDGFGINLDRAQAMRLTRWAAKAVSP